MLYINDRYQWHIGEPIPSNVEHKRVVMFQADGDELNLFLNAMAASAAPLRGSNIGYSKLKGFQVEDIKPKVDL